jgi:hypothetical protein
MDESEREIREIARQISRYLQSHPKAADSAEGILHWWLPHQRLEESMQKVERALALLLRDGAVKQKVLIDGSVLYIGAKRLPDDIH